MTEPKANPFADRFAEAFQAAMRAEYEETAKAPDVVNVAECLIDVVDADDRHLPA